MIVIEKGTKSVSVRLLSFRYIVALSLIALLSVAIYFVSRQQIIDEQASAAIINISGRQRMLIQKTALYSLYITENADPVKRAALRAELTRTVDLLEDSHEGLIHGNREMGLPGELSPEVGALLFNQPVNLGERVYRYCHEARVLLNTSDSELTRQNRRLADIIASVDELTNDMNKLVAQFQKESETRMARLQALQGIILITMLTVLLLEAVFIFRPAVRFIHHENERLAAANTELKRISNMDGLTGIANRRSFDEVLDREWNRAARQRVPITLVMVDIDHFKYYNDTYGHQMGDECLKQVARALEGSVNRATDFVARYGGEEFGVILPETRIEGATKVAEKLRIAIEELHIQHKSSPVSAVLTISVGTATVIPAFGNKPKDILSLADKALYQAKQKGRNRIEVYDYTAKS